MTELLTTAWIPKTRPELTACIVCVNKNLRCVQSDVAAALDVALLECRLEMDGQAMQPEANEPKTSPKIEAAPFVLDPALDGLYYNNKLRPPLVSTDGTVHPVKHFCRVKKEPRMK